MGLLPLAYPFSLPLGASYWNFLGRADPHLSALYLPLVSTGLTVLFLLLSLVGVLMQLLPFHFSKLFLFSIPSPLLSGLSLNCLAKNIVASQSTKRPFGPFAPPSFSTVRHGYLVRLIDSADSPLFHS